MKRRQFLGAGLTLTCLPHIGRAQSGKPLAGFLNNGFASSYARHVSAFRSGLKEMGYIEGQNLNIEYRWAEGDDARLPALASELVRQGVVVLAATGGTNSVLAAKSRAPELPIVFAIGGDPLKFDLVRSLNQPGGNVTGATFLANALLPKQFALLYEIAQRPRRVGFMVNPANPNAEQNTADVVAASASVGSELIVVQASTREEVEQAFAKFQVRQIGALVIFPDALFTGLRDVVATLALRAGIPTVYNSHEFAIAGGFVGYGPDQMETYRQAGRYIGRVLSGEKVSELPVMQPTRFELFINLKTAKALNLGVPPNILALADEVIE